MTERHYVNEFFRLKCASDLLAKKLFPNAKEMTESMGAFAAVQRHIVKPLGLSLGDRNIGLYVVGDGHTPRTAALFAMRSAWECYSIDPVLRDKVWGVDRLHAYTAKIENCSLLHAQDFERAIIVMVHSHARIEDTLQAIQNKNRSLVTIPCCVKHEIPDVSYIGYQDGGIWSPQNTVKVWESV